MKDLILIVEDNADNITILTLILKDKYRLKVAKSGEAAIKIIETQTVPDLILLDIIMPGMDGYSVCLQLKYNPKYRDIPIIFISALSDSNNILSGFSVGAIDYITKPFHVDEVLLRVNTHLSLKNAKKDIQDLLSNTLIGCIKVMLEMLTITNPILIKKTNRLRFNASKIINKLEIPSNISWEIHLAIMLSQIGCISIPNDIIIKRESNGRLKDDEIQSFKHHPMVGSDLIAKIPRLENVADIVKYQLYYPDELPNDMNKITILGCAILNILITYDDMLINKISPNIAIEKMIRMGFRYPTSILNAFLYTVKKETKFNKKEININSLMPGMILYDDLYSNSGSLLLPSKTEITEYIIELLKKWNTKGVFTQSKINISLCRL